MKKKRLMRRKRKARVRFQERKRERLLQLKARKYHIHWYLPRRIKRHLARFLDIFKKLEITLPFGEALQQMQLYAKFLKDMLTKKN